MTSNAPRESPRSPVDPEPSAAGPLSVGFVLTAVALLVVVGGGVLAATSDDDWLLLVVPGVLVLLVGILKIAEGIHHLVAAYERSLGEH